MTRVEESSDAAAGVSEFAFVHSGEYRETQQEFWDAVESLDPDRIIVRLVILIITLQYYR